MIAQHMPDKFTRTFAERLDRDRPLWRIDYAPTDDGNLDINQVRVRVFLARPDQVQHLAMKRLLTFTVTMRAKSAEQQRIDDSILLGTERPGLTRN